jgi:hypothetical protein
MLFPPRRSFGQNFVIIFVLPDTTFISVFAFVKHVNVRAKSAKRTLLRSASV